MIRCKSVHLVATFIVVVISLCSAGPTQNFNKNDHNPVPTTNKQSAYKNNTREEQEGTIPELFAFPAEPSTIESKQNARNRTPVFLPQKCQENEILYPGDQESDWVCDCKPTFVYHPKTRKCYEMYTQGYCDNGMMIHLKPGAKYADCILNQCPNGDNNLPQVLYNGRCVALNQYHDGCKFGEIQRVVGVDEKTHELACLDISVVNVQSASQKQASGVAAGSEQTITPQPYIAEKKRQ